MKDFTKFIGNLVFVTNDNVEKAIRKFKKKVADSGILQEMRERESYEKPTTRRRRAKNSASHRWRKKLEADRLPKKLY